MGVENLQNQSSKNENGAQKNLHIFKSNAPTLQKLGVYLEHMFTKGYIFSSICVISSWNKTMCKKFVTKGEIMQQPLCLTHQAGKSTMKDSAAKSFQIPKMNIVD